MDRHIFQYGDAEIRYLKKRDKILGLAIDRIGMIEREVTPDPFTALVSSIVAQQISAKAAATVWDRMQERFGTITGETLASVSPEEIRQCGMSLRKAGYIHGIGTAVKRGEMDFSRFGEMSDSGIIDHLTALPGVGKWTAEMLLLFSLERPDVVSWNDLAIRRGMMNLYNRITLTREQFERYRKRYSPYGSVASLYLWAVSHE
ncbi:DNA-3-methyladenine glycosylase [uncultured Methanoregula sp.]|uniref:DNA-3-methyladenine glycosylase family protein n=1 Tax=uncultured Methanoregula sp. TaxID=1005933 RepID=UPI002AAAF317|nr:DNA-3-methyladenine glycosylase [uncultured Methanoregula sp.]